jgi:hypothetical protein
MMKFFQGEDSWDNISTVRRTSCPQTFRPRGLKNDHYGRLNRQGGVTKGAAGSWRVWSRLRGFTSTGTRQLPPGFSY